MREEGIGEDDEDDRELVVVSRLGFRAVIYKDCNPTLLCISFLLYFPVNLTIPKGLCFHVYSITKLTSSHRIKTKPNCPLLLLPLLVGVGVRCGETHQKSVRFF